MKAYTFERTVIEKVTVFAETDADARKVARQGAGEVVERTVLPGEWLQGHVDVQP